MSESHDWIIVQHNPKQPNNIQKHEEYITIAPNYRTGNKTIIMIIIKLTTTTIIIIKIKQNNKI